jgi:hypothetical protein
MAKYKSLLTNKLYIYELDYNHYNRTFEVGFTTCLGKVNKTSVMLSILWVFVFCLPFY